MAGCTLRANRRLGLALLGLGLGLLGCQLLEPTEPHASRDVLDAIYAGIKRAQEQPDGPPAEPAPPSHPS
jgi:hypothetical protein